MSEQYQYNEHVVPIVSIDFATLSSKNIKSMSVFSKDGNGVTVSELHSNNEPKKDSLVDRKFGTTSTEQVCETCGLGTKFCEGHSGHIKLGSIVYNISYYENVKKYLKCVCQQCSNVVVEPLEREKLKHTGKKVIPEIIEIRKKTSSCWKCNSPLGTIKSNKKGEPIAILIDYKLPTENKDIKDLLVEKKSEPISQKTVMNIFRNVSDEDHYFLGLDPKKGRLENMMIEYLYVPSIVIRPSIRGDFTASSKSSEDHLTSHLLNIVKDNNDLLKKNEITTMSESHISKKNDSIEVLQDHVISYFDRESKASSKFEQKGIPLKSISERLKGKDGRIRTNLMGKRIEFSARTVITPDPKIGVNEVGLPVTIAKQITFPEIVTPYNYDEMQQLVRNGRNIYPGANYIIPISNDGSYEKRFQLDWSKTPSVLKYNDIVERHIRTGDRILINRQPSLHEGSMMTHTAIVIDNIQLSTLRLNPAVVHPYNADFDGDEMNAFFSQSIQTMIELEEISDVKYQIVSAQSSATTVGAIWDGINGGYMLTRDSQYVNWRTGMNILANTEFRDIETFKKNINYRGKDIYSKIIPTRINMYKEDDGKTLIEIKNGEITQGHITNVMIGYGKKNNLIQTILNEYNPDTSINFINSTVKLTDNFLLGNGFTASLGDLQAPVDLRKKIYQNIQTNLLEVQHEITEYENNYNMLNEKLFEKVVRQKLGLLREESGKLILNNMPQTHNLKIMIDAGSKFKLESIGEISGCLGQVDYAGKRAPKTYNNRNLPFFHQNDDTGLARGFIEHGLLKGLTLPEFYFHHYQAREGLIDTSLKTAESGYMQRKLVKACEDSMVKYDGTVRNASNRIQQFIYGDSGVNTIKQTSYNIKYVMLSNEDIEIKYKLTKEELEKCKNYVNKNNNSKNYNDSDNNNNNNKNYNNYYNDSDNNDYYNKIIKFRDHLRKTQIKALNKNVVLNSTYMLPANLSMIFTNAKNDETLMGEICYDPKYILEKIDYLILPTVTFLFSMSEEDMENPNSIKYKDEQVAKTVFKYALYDILCPKNCFNNKLSKKQIDYICDMFAKSFNKTIVEAGEMIGIIAAQSIGEPLTQMTLNSFHSTGISGKGASNLGMSRINEIFRLSTNLKDPEMTIILDKKYSNNKDYANKIASHIKYTTVKDLRKNIESTYNSEPYKKNSIIEIDNVHNIYAPNDYKTPPLEQVPWLIRIEFDKEKMFQKEITLLDIKSKLFTLFNKSSNFYKTINIKKKPLLDKINAFVIMSNTDNDNIPIIHLRLDINNVNSETIIDFMTFYIDDFNLKGIENIEEVYVEEVRTLHFTETGKVENKIEYLLKTTGINLNAIRNLNGIDLDNTYFNDIIQIYSIYGVEAARSLLISEITTIIEAPGTFVNFQHISIFADLMTNIGTLTSIDRHGVSKLDTEPLARASFEKTIEHMLNAALYNEVDNIKSVSSQIMAGLCIKGGTGLSKLIIDKEMLENSEFTGDNSQDFNKTYNDISASLVVHDVNTNVFIPEF